MLQAIVRRASQGGEFFGKIKETSRTKLYGASDTVYVDQGTGKPHDFHDVNDAMECAVNELLAGKESPLIIIHEIVIEKES